MTVLDTMIVIVAGYRPGWRVRPEYKPLVYAMAAALVVVAVATATSIGTAVLVVAGVAGGALNTMAAGGGVLTFLALLLTGMPPQMAIATSQVAIPASFLGGIRRAWQNRAEYRPVLPGIVAAMAGTALGVWVVAQLTATTFRALAPVLLVVAAVLLVIQPYMPRLLGRRAGDDSQRRPIVVAIALFGVAIYGGAFGGGVAVAVLAVFAACTPWSWHKSNNTKNVACLAMSVVCSVAFAFTGLAAWGPAALLAVSQLAGGALGTRLAKRLSADTLRKTVAVATFLGAGALFGAT